MKKGSITIFLALLLTISISLSMGALEASRVHGLKLTLETAAASATDSVLAAYDRDLLDEFDIFMLNEQEVSAQEEMEWYLEQELDPKTKGFWYYGNLFRQQVSAVTIEDVIYADARGGDVFIQDILDYMKYRTVGIGIDIFKEQLGLVEEGKNAKDSVQESIDDADAESEKSLNEEISDEDRKKYEEIMEESWVEKIKRIREDGWLEFILPMDSAASSVTIDGKALPSDYVDRASHIYPLNFGSLTDQMMFTEYIIEHCGSFTTADSNREPVYELEYVFSGEKSDRESLKSVLKALIIMREAMNLLSILKTPELSLETGKLAAVLAGWTGLAPVIGAVQLAISAGWSFAETIVDARTLLSGGRIPLLKDYAGWSLTIEQVPQLLDGDKLLIADGDTGLAYEDYLRLLLYTVNIQKKAYRMMDIIQLRMKKIKPDFDIFQCTYGFQINVISKADGLFFNPKGGYKLSSRQSRMY